MDYESPMSIDYLGERFFAECVHIVCTHDHVLLNCHTWTYLLPHHLPRVLSRTDYGNSLVTSEQFARLQRVQEWNV